MPPPPFSALPPESGGDKGRGRVKCGVVRSQVAAVSNGIDRFEEHTIRRIADLLYLSHDRFIEAKLRARKHS